MASYGSSPSYSFPARIRVMPSTAKAINHLNPAPNTYKPFEAGQKVVPGGTFTITHSQRDNKSFKLFTPGPQDYAVKPQKKIGDGPRCLMASKMHIQNPLEDNPGPGTYPIVTKAIRTDTGFSVPHSAQ